MKVRFIVWLALAALIAGPAVSSAQQPGEIFGKVTDASGGVLPGVTVTVTGPVLLQPLVAVSSETGRTGSRVSPSASKEGWQIPYAGLQRFALCLARRGKVHG